MDKQSQGHHSAQGWKTPLKHWDVEIRFRVVKINVEAPVGRHVDHDGAQEQHVDRAHAIELGEERGRLHANHGQQHEQVHWRGRRVQELLERGLVVFVHDGAVVVDDDRVAGGVEEQPGVELHLAVGDVVGVRLPRAVHVRDADIGASPITCGQICVGNSIHIKFHCWS